MIDNGAFIDCTDSFGDIPMHYACHYGKDRELFLFLQFFLINRVNISGHIEIVQLLIQHGSNINAVNNEKETPFWLATLGGIFVITINQIY